MSIDYKYKPEKHKFRVNLKTIDELHKEHLETFRKQHELIPMKKTKLQNLKRELEILETEKNNTNPVNLNVEYIKKRNSLKKSISLLENEISKIVNYKNELE